MSFLTKVSVRTLDVLYLVTMGALCVAVAYVTSAYAAEKRTPGLELPAGMHEGVREGCTPPPKAYGDEPASDGPACFWMGSNAPAEKGHKAACVFDTYIVTNDEAPTAWKCLATLVQKDCKKPFLPFGLECESEHYNKQKADAAAEHTKNPAKEESI